MKKKVLLMTLIGLLLLGAVIGVALNAVFTVTDVKIGFSTNSETGKAESFDIQRELEEEFVGKSTTFLDLDDVQLALERHPAFRVDSVRKVFPNTLVLSLTERTEVFAFARRDGGYAILDGEGTYLYDKEENANRRGGANLELFGFLDLSAEKAGSVATGTCFSELLTMLSVFREGLGDVRANLSSVWLLHTENPVQGEYYFRFTMKEGVTVNVYTPENFTEAKAEEILKTYLSLTDEQKLYGLFDVIDDLEGWFRISQHRAETPSDDDPAA